MKKSIIIIIFLLTITACSSSPSEADIQTAIAKTKNSQPEETLAFTDTSAPTNTITPTHTSTPTSTSTPTNTITPTNTLTPTNTNTATPIPPATLTQQAVELTRTQQAMNVTSTQNARNSLATATASARTKTAISNYATATEVASYKEIYWKELINYPKNYLLQKIVVRGRVFNIEDEYIQMFLAGTYEAVVVVFEKEISGFYDGDSITVYGIVYGEECGTNAFGGEVCQPAILASWYTKP